MDCRRDDVSKGTEGSRAGLWVVPQDSVSRMECLGVHFSGGGHGFSLAEEPADVSTERHMRARPVKVKSGACGNG